MPDILHRVKATPKKIFEALSTIDGLSHWWIVDTKGNAKQGGIRARIDGGCGLNERFQQVDGWVTG